MSYLALQLSHIIVQKQMEEKSEKLDAKGDPGAPRVDIVVVPVVLIIKPLVRLLSAIMKLQLYLLIV